MIINKLTYIKNHLLHVFLADSTIQKIFSFFIFENNLPNKFFNSKPFHKEPVLQTSCIINHVNMWRKPSVVKLCITILLLSSSISNCTGAIRNSEQLKKDNYFEWQIKKHNTMQATDVLQITGSKDNYNLINDRALAFARLFEVDKTERILLGILAIRNNYMPAYLNLSRLYAILDEPGRLKKIHRRMVLERRFSDSFLYNTALKFSGQNRELESQSLMQSLGEYRNSNRAYLWLAAKYFEDQNYNKTIEIYEKILTRSPKNTEALFGIAYLYYLANNSKLALQYFEVAQQNSSKEVLLKFFIADCLAKQNKIDKALRVIKSASPKERVFAMIELHGLLLLRLDYKRDLGFLLKEVKLEREKKKLKQSWFSGQDIEFRKKYISPEFSRMN